MAFRETEIGECLQLFVDPVDHLVVGAMHSPHTVEEPAAQPMHAFGRPLGTHSTPQLIGLSAGKAGAVHRELHQLFLKQWNSQRLPQRRLHRRMVVDDWVEAVAPPDVRVHRATLDRPGTAFRTPPIRTGPAWPGRPRCLCARPPGRWRSAAPKAYPARAGRISPNRLPR